MEHLKSFKKKMIAIVSGSLIIACTVISSICIQYLSNVRSDDSKQIMQLLCSQYTNQTEGHLENVEQTVNLLYGYAHDKLLSGNNIYDIDNAMAVIEKTRTMAYGAANNISTAHAVYLRLNPDIYGKDSVFFMVRDNGDFEDVTPTDISAYDKNDKEHVGWYYLPFENGGPGWLEPYNNENIGVYMITYAIPIIYEGNYIGVMGMDVDLAVLNESINQLSAFDGGYTYLKNQEGSLVFDSADRAGDKEWLTVSQPLHNGMILSVTAPYNEINSSRRILVIAILLTSLAVLAVSILVAVMFAVKINRVLSSELENAYSVQQEALNAANRASAAKSDFLSRMSHDIRTPMNAIIGMTAIAESHLNDAEKLENCINKISVSARHLLGIINDILDMSKIESGKFQIREAEFYLSDLINELLELVSAQAKAKNHTIKVYLHNIEHENVIGDSGHIQQVLINILSNAVKYTHDNGTITLDVTEYKTDDPDVGRYEFVFTDNGIGMSPELVSCIFEPFERGEDTRVNRIQGTGLGMAIANSIVNHIGGTIHVESEPGKGSRFTINISMKLMDTVIADIDDLKGLPVLLADNDPISCENLSFMLNELGMKCEYVLSGEEAVRKAVEHHKLGDDYFAIILDWKMPEMDGLETAHCIRGVIGDHVPIIFLSAFDWSDIEDEANSEGINVFLSKPVFRYDIVKTLRSIIKPKEEISEEPKTDGFNELKKQDFSDCRLLLVEDNEINREIAVEILSVTGAAIETAEDGEQAVKMISDSGPGRYDMILMDIQMPRMNGYEATKAIRAMGGAWSSIPIIAMTANTFDEDVQAALKAGMNEHLAKPIDLGQMNNVMKRWLSKNK